MDLSVEGKSERIPPGSHILQLYNKVAEISGVTARLLEVGLSQHEKCLFAGTPASVQELEQGLAKLGVDMPAAKESGQILFVTDRDELLVNKRFDPYHLLSHHQTFIAQGLRERYKAVRISM
ncbi:MAG: MEDS domain-containing protein, partial [Ktedonobacterales bacterium]|nr:MEDS domain-containing protein [Ktedonobacterales bacterium]